MNSRIALAAFATAAALSAMPALAITTGNPGGSPVGAYTFDSTDYYAEKVSFVAASTIESISLYVLSGIAGETFTVALYDTSGTGGLPGSVVYSGRAQFTADGWNGLSGLSGWTVAASSYWVAFEIVTADPPDVSDTLGTGSVTGALLPTGALPFGATAFNDGSGYRLATQGLTFGVALTDSAAAAVPEPAQWALWLAGAGLIAGTRRLRR